MGYQRRVHGDCTLGQCSVTMLRPLLLLLPCLLALAWGMDDLRARGHLDRDIPGFDQEFEDMEDELEEDFEEERSLNTDDFDEHADDMEDLEDLTPEEAEDREAILDDREGRLAGPIVRCGRWTNRVVELDGNTTAKFESTKITNRCTVLYKPTNCTGPIKYLQQIPGRQQGPDALQERGLFHHKTRRQEQHRGAAAHLVQTRGTIRKLPLSEPVRKPEGVVQTQHRAARDGQVPKRESDVLYLVNRHS